MMLRGTQYDFIVELSESFMNRSLEKMYEESIIPHEIKGTYKLDLPKVIKEFGKLDYRIIFTEPLYIDAMIENQVLIHFSADVSLIFSLLLLDLNVEGNIQCNPFYDIVKNELTLRVIDVQIGSTSLKKTVKVHEALLGLINDLVKDTVKGGLNKFEIPVSPIIGNLTLPEMPEGQKYMLPVGLGNVQIIDENVITFGFNVARHGEGTRTHLEALKLKNDLAFAFSESAINKVVDFWWSYTTHSKSIFFKERIKIDRVEELVNYLSSFSIELLPKMFTLGFVEIDLHFLEIWLDYEGKVELIKPKITLKDRDLKLETVALVDLTGFLRTELDIAVQFDTSGPIPDLITPWEDDKIVGKQRRVFDVFRYTFTDKRVELTSSDASIDIDEKRRIILKKNKFDLDIGINWRLPRRIMKLIEKRLEKNIIELFPELPISPTVINQQIENSNLLLNLNVMEITLGENEVIIQADVEYSKLKEKD